MLFPSEQISGRVAELGDELTRDYAGSVPLLVTVLKSATVFVADLTRELDLQHEMDFIAVSSYGAASGGVQARIMKDLQIPATGRDVVLVEDIIDTGLTLGFIMKWLHTHEPASVRVCTLLDRPHRRLVETPIAYRGFSLPDRFMVGYGLDYQQAYRHLPDLHELELDGRGELELLRDSSA